MNNNNNRDIPSKLLPILLLLLGFVSVNQWSRLPIGNTTTTWLLDIGILITLFLLKLKNKVKFFSWDYITTTLFLCIAVAGFFRGSFTADNYWEWKNLISNMMTLLMPICVFAFYEPSYIQNSVRMWFKYGIIAYAIFFFWMVGISQFYLAPIFFAASFLPLIPKRRWKVIVILLTIALLAYHYQDNRSQAIKAIVALSMALGCILHKWIPNILLKAIQVALIIVPCYLLYLGFTGEYNIFEEINDKYKDQDKIEVEVVDEDGFVHKVDVDAVDDTRTFIYEEVAMSAVYNDYVVWGRTPARGNDTYFFYDMAQSLRQTKYEDTIKNERSMNELCFPNIFTWLGLVGMISYILIYLHASFLAVYRSKSFYMKMIGVYIAFNFAFGWVENTTVFDILNFVYWFAISMALSTKFRNMTDKEFKAWFAEIFNIKYKLYIPTPQA